jgi:hypothetical protein
MGRGRGTVTRGAFECSGGGRRGRAGVLPPQQLGLKSADVTRLAERRAQGYDVVRMAVARAAGRSRV